MDFIQTTNKQVDKFGSGKHGFQPGNPSTGVLATFLSQTWCDNVQQEIVNAIEGAGLTVNPAQNNQLLQAIQSLVSQDYKTSCRAMTTGNIANLAGGAPNATDGVALAVNDRVFVPNQTSQVLNGLYKVVTLGTGANGTWVRCTDADGVGEMTSGMVVAVEEGTTGADTLWMLTTDGTITIGTTSITFALKASSLPIGVNQSWQDMTGSRSNNTTYTNSTNRPIQISIIINASGSFQGNIVINGANQLSSGIVGAGLATHQFTYVIPPGGTYATTLTAGSINSWWELR